MTWSVATCDGAIFQVRDNKEGGRPLCCGHGAGASASDVVPGGAAATRALLTAAALPGAAVKGQLVPEPPHMGAIGDPFKGSSATTLLVRNRKLLAVAFARVTDGNPQAMAQGPLDALAGHRGQVGLSVQPVWPALPSQCEVPWGRDRASAQQARLSQGPPPTPGRGARRRCGVVAGRPSTRSQRTPAPHPLMPRVPATPSCW